jgi:fermentation-respiration switch protein FrsA (DUF1100 family)
MGQETPAAQTRNVEFRSDERITLRGWLKVPAGPGPHPLIVLAHGFGGLKEWFLPEVGDRFAAAGFVALGFDYRNFGDSDGTPREEVDPFGQFQDWQSAITFGSTLDEVDPDRIGIWGTSLGGKNALLVAAFDRRVRCVVAQAPAVDWGEAVLLHQNNAHERKELLAGFDADRRARFLGEEPAYVRTDESADTRRFLDTLSEEERKQYKGRLTLRSWEPTPLSSAIPFMHLIAPRPLLMLVLDEDTITPLPGQLEAYDRAREPKKLIYISGGHDDIYRSPQKDIAVPAATEWFVEHLRP